LAEKVLEKNKNKIESPKKNVLQVWRMSTHIHFFLTYNYK
jgi:hypothetical protein